MKIFLIVLCSLIAGPCCFASGTFLLKGKIDDSVVMLFRCDDTSCSGTYFCLSDLKDKEFEGHRKDSGYEFYVFAPAGGKNGYDTVTTIYLKPSDGHSWVGWSASGKRPKSPVKLEERVVTDGGV